VIKSKNTKSVDLKGRMFSCPAQGKQTSFQLVDEFGSGAPYAGLAFEVVDFEGMRYSGLLNSDGVGYVTNHCAGSIVVTMISPYRGVSDC